MIAYIYLVSWTTLARNTMIYLNCLPRWADAFSTSLGLSHIWGSIFSIILRRTYLEQHLLWDSHTTSASALLSYRMDHLDNSVLALFISLEEFYVCSSFPLHNKVFEIFPVLPSQILLSKSTSSLHQTSVSLPEDPWSSC